jgi:hypothetical protein
VRKSNRQRLEVYRFGANTIGYEVAVADEKLVNLEVFKDSGIGIRTRTRKDISFFCSRRYSHESKI